jgi:cytoskeleton protein RodZ
VARYEEVEGLPIGEVLKRARSRKQIDISAVEERTKIRIKYLRAMEQDEWDVLPSRAYAKGFLRTYASLLGLDADALVDEYRRQYEGPAEQGPYTFTEPVLEGRRPLGGGPGRGPRWGPILVLGALAVVGVLLVLGLTGGDEGKGGKHGKHQHRHEQRHHRHQKAASNPPPEQTADKVSLRLEVHSPVQVCLLGSGSSQPLIDDQVLSAGASEGTYNASSFDLRFPSGYDLGLFDLILDDKKAKLPETQGPTAFKVTPPDKVRQVTFPGPDCP